MFKDYLMLVVHSSPFLTAREPAFLPGCVVFLGDPAGALPLSFIVKWFLVPSQVMKKCLGQSAFTSALSCLSMPISPVLT